MALSLSHSQCMVYVLLVSVVSDTIFPLKIFPQYLAKCHSKVSHEMEIST